MGTYESPIKPQPSGRGIFNLREDHDLSAKYASLARKVEALETKKKLNMLKQFKKLHAIFVILMNMLHKIA